MKRIIWKNETVLNVRLREDLYTLAQMRMNHCLQFFDIKNAQGDWQNVDLNTVRPLFSLFVSESRLKTLFVGTLTTDLVKPDQRPMQMHMLDYRFGNEGKHSADLIELDQRFSTMNAKIMKANLSIEQDLQDIYEHEYAGVIGDPEKLRSRLIRYFETGVNWDDSKSFIFPGIQPPPAKRN